MLLENVGIHQEEISAFCRRWQIVELALFGSILREVWHTATLAIPQLIEKIETLLPPKINVA